MYTAVLVGLVGALIALLLGPIANFRVHKKPASCVICGTPIKIRILHPGRIRQEGHCQRLPELP